MHCSNVLRERVVFYLHAILTREICMGELDANDLLVV